MQPQLGPEGCVRHGVASWTDDSLIGCGKFYPAKAKKDDLLRLYATKMPTVEVDMSTYVIPTVNRMEQWVKAVPKVSAADFCVCVCVSPNVPVALTECHRRKRTLSSMSKRIKFSHIAVRIMASCTCVSPPVFACDC